jgi:hypothetical protein
MKRRGNQLGQSAVEFALIMPVLVLILMGVFDFGRAFYAYSVVANAAREGARVGIFSAATDAQIRAAVRQYWVGLGTVSDSSITISPAEKRLSGELIEVAVRYEFVPITPVIDAFLPGGKIALASSSIMRVE